MEALKIPVRLYTPQRMQARIHADIIYSKAKYFVINAGRQSGKTTLAEQQMIHFAFGYPDSVISWFSASNGNNDKVYARLVKALKWDKYGRETGFVRGSNEQKHVVELINGTRIQFESMQKADLIRGDSPNFAFLDEAALYNKNDYDKVLDPLFKVKPRKILFMSTPRGVLNWFYDMFERGASDEFRWRRWKSYTFNYLTNPFADKEDIENSKLSLPEAIFRQEYLAEFVSDGGAVFPHVDDCICKDPFPEPPQSGKRYYAGVDLGKEVDSSSLTIVDQNLKVVYHDSFQVKGMWQNTADKMIPVLQLYGFPFTTFEVNMVGGDALYDMFRERVGARNAYKMLKVRTTNEYKNRLIENLVMLFQTKQISIPNREELIKQLKVYTFDFSPLTKTLRYNAPPGYHDDEVMSLAFAVDAFIEQGSKGSTLEVFRKK